MKVRPLFPLAVKWWGLLQVHEQDSVVFDPLGYQAAQEAVAVDNLRLIRMGRRPCARRLSQIVLFNSIHSPDCQRRLSPLGESCK